MYLSAIGNAKRYKSLGSRCYHSNNFIWPEKGSIFDMGEKMREKDEIQKKNFIACVDILDKCCLVAMKTIVNDIFHNNLLTTARDTLVD